jgi:CspA family cold shock protein
MAKQGKVKWFSNAKGYGFIEQPDGADAFVHYSDIITEERYKTLYPGQDVEYELTDSERGPKALNVQVVGKPEPPNAAPEAPGPMGPVGL